MKGCDGTTATRSSLASNLPPEARCATIEIVILLQKPAYLEAIMTKITVTYTTFINMEVFPVILTFSLEILQLKTLVEM
jgi:hypothetical protein